MMAYSSFKENYGAFQDEKLASLEKIHATLGKMDQIYKKQDQDY